MQALEVSGGLVAPLVFKTSVRLNKVSGGFDSHPPPPSFPQGDMARRIPQPQVIARLRPTEAHGGWLGLMVILIAAALLTTGAQHWTQVNTTDGNSAKEAQLVKAFTCGGLQAKTAVTMPDLSQYDDPAQAAAALDRMARERAHSFPIRYQVNTGAADPCPT